MKRRDFLKLGAAASMASISWNKKAFAEDEPMPGRNRFVLYLHFGSVCGISSGLVQPLKAGEWPMGWHNAGQGGGSVNGLLNRHTQVDGFVLHDYNKFLAPMVKDMCLVNGNSQSLDHNVAGIIQRRGTGVTSFAPEWPMGLAQFMQSDKRKNPIVVSSGVKTMSVPDITPIGAKSVQDFQRITSDLGSIPKDGAAPFLDLIKARFRKAKLGTVVLDKSLPEAVDYQLNTLSTGLKELTTAKDDIAAIKEALSNKAFEETVKDCVEREDIQKRRNDELREYLALAGILAKTGLANGMSINVMNEDQHNGGCDNLSPREASAAWAFVSLLWKWVAKEGLQNDFMIIVSHDFSRTAYNGNVVEHSVLNENGQRINIKAPGRDHDLSMGMMFIHPGVPKSGRIGLVSDNLAPVATKDARGTIDKDLAAYTSECIVGSMFMRIFPELFPSERIVRKHWPTFKEVGPILA